MTWSLRLRPHVTWCVTREPSSGLTRHIPDAGEKYTVLSPYRMGGLLPTPGNSGRGGDFFAVDFVACVDFGTALVAAFDMDFPAAFVLGRPFPALTALVLGVGAIG